MNKTTKDILKAALIGTTSGIVIMFAIPFLTVLVAMLLKYAII